MTETVIAKVEAGYGNGGSQVVTRTVNYNYATFADPALAGSSWLTLSGASYGDGSQAYYTYQSLYAGQKPLLFSADDPRMDGSATRIVYEFWRAQGSVLGSVYAERDYATNQILAKFEQGASGAAGTRKITYANGGVENVALASNSRANTSTDGFGS